MSLRILFADDSMTAQNMGKKILTEAGYEVVAVSNGAAAVKKIAEQRPDVAVLDVYMPGYTGLEVCERLKSARDTTHMPVLLTVGRMEPFKPEEGNRVKADGIIIKPFEASDLLAAIQKIEQRLPARAAAGGRGASEEVSIYERTQKINIPFLEDFKDASYEEWKVAAGGQAPEAGSNSGTPAVPAFGLPEGLEGAPAMGMDELEVVPASGTETLQRVTEVVEAAPPPPPPMPPSRTGDTLVAGAPRTGTTQLDPATALASAAPAPAPAVGTAKASTSGVWRALDKAREWFGTPGGAPPTGAEVAPAEKPAAAPVATVQELALPSQSPAHSGPEPTYEKTQYFPKRASDAPQSTAPAHAGDLLEHTASEAVDVVAAKDPHFEATASPHLDSLEVDPDPDLEPTLHAKDHSPTIASSDPGLVTDPSELVKEFPTRFGVPNPEVVPVGIASDYPQLYADAGNTESAAPVEEDEELEDAALAEVLSEQVTAPAGNAPAAAVASKSAWVAEEAPLEAHENRGELHKEMQSVFAKAAPASPEVEVELVEPDAEAEAEASDVGSAVDPELAAAMAAAVGAEIAPAVTHLAMETKASEDHEENHTALAADIVHRVTEMLKPELIRRIAAELRKKK